MYPVSLCVGGLGLEELNEVSRDGFALSWLDVLFCDGTYGARDLAGAFYLGSFWIWKL